MGNETKEAFEAMNLSTEQLEMALEAAKSSEGFQSHDKELSQISEMISKMHGMFAEASRSIIQPRAERGNIQAQKETLENLTNQYQAMNALVATMTQTLMGLEGVKDRFEQVFGGTSGVLANAENAQKMPGASQLQFSGVYDSTKESLEQFTNTFKNLLNEQLAIYEAIGAEYYQMMPSMKFVPNAPHPPENPKDDGDENNGTDPTDNPENPAGNPENPEEQNGTQIPPAVMAPSGGSSASTGGGAAPAGGAESQGSGAAPIGGCATAAAPAGGAESQGSGAAPVGGGAAAAAPAGGAESQGTGTAPVGGGATAAAPVPGSAAPQGQPSGGSHASGGSAHSTDAQDRGRSDERQKSRKKNSKPK